mgnify:CR=1 FL=1|jgi:hypothetical protein|tara:strand:+ start:48 stop:578 length:531 start_codon:yes stop_codon:yes gene_type:complete
MINYPSLTNLPEINFKSKERPALDELATYIDQMKTTLFEDRWSQTTKKHIKASLVLYIRTMQKQLAPMGYHYKAIDIKGKQHLEHVIPQNKIITAYLHDKISAKIVLQMPLCLIDDTDKHILEGDWQTAGNWEYPFRRYKSAGFGKIIKDVKGRSVDLETYTLQQHFDMLGYKVDR